MDEYENIGREKEVKFGTYFCPECGSQIPAELLALLKNNKRIYCENCGLPIDFSDKVVKKIKKEQKFIEQSKYRREMVEQTKNNWNMRESSIESDVELGVVMNKAVNTSALTGSTTANKKPQKISEKTIKDIEHAIKTINDINKSALWPIIAIIITISRLIGLFYNFSMNALVGSILNLIVFFLVVAKLDPVVSKEIPNKEYNNIGVELILFGAIGSAAYGLGVLYIIEGVLILADNSIKRYNETIVNFEERLRRDKDAKEINVQLRLDYNIDNKGNVKENIKEDVKFSNEDLIKEYKYIGIEFNSRIIRVLMENIVYGTFLILILNINKLYSLSLTEASINFNMIGFFIIGWIYYSVLKSNFIVELKNKPFNEINYGKVVELIVFSAICTANGSGVLGLILGILLLVHKNLLIEIKNDLEQMEKRDRIKYEEHRNIEEAVDLMPKQKDFQTNQIDKANAKISTNKPKSTLEKSESPKVRELLPQDKDQIKQPQQPRLESIPLIETLKQSEKKPLPVGNVFNDKAKEDQINSYLKRIFTVLSGETRQKIMQLDITEEEKNSILQEFVYLTEEQQQKYLEELENVNRKLSWKLIEKVMKLNISEKEKKEIIRNLEYMTSDAQKEYIYYLLQDNVDNIKTSNGSK
ncbi:MAG: hypothetical protein ACTSRZ_10860 [Promethearchaeota archaeon]